MNIYILLLFVILFLYLFYNKGENFITSSDYKEISDEEDQIDILNLDKDDIKGVSNDLYKKSFHELNQYKDSLIKPHKNYTDHITDYHFNKYGQVYDKSFTVDDLDDLDDKEKQELKDQNYIDTSQYPSHYNSMEGLNYKKALLDVSKMQNLEDVHLHKLNVLID